MSYKALVFCLLVGLASALSVNYIDHVKKHHRHSHHRHRFGSNTTGQVTTVQASGSVDAQLTAFGIEGSVGLSGTKEGSEMTLGGSISVFFYVTVGPTKFKAGIEVQADIEMVTAAPNEAGLGEAIKGSLGNWLKGVYGNSPSVKQLKALSTAQIAFWKAQNKDYDSRATEATLEEIKVREQSFFFELEQTWASLKSTIPDTAARFTKLKEKAVDMWASNFMSEERAKEVAIGTQKFYDPNPATRKDKQIDGSGSLSSNKAFLHCSKDSDRGSKATLLEIAMCRYFKAAFFYGELKKDAKYSDVLNIGFKNLYPNVFGDSVDNLISLFTFSAASRSGGRLQLLAQNPDDLVASLNALTNAADEPYQVKSVKFTGSLTFKMGVYAGQMALEIKASGAKSFEWTRQGAVLLRSAPIPAVYTLTAALAPSFEFSTVYTTSPKFKKIGLEMSTCLPISWTAFNKAASSTPAFAQWMAQSFIALKTAVYASQVPSAEKPSSTSGFNTAKQWFKWLNSDSNLHSAMGALGAQLNLVNGALGGLSAATTIASVLTDYLAGFAADSQRSVCVSVNFKSPGTAATGSLTVNFVQTVSVAVGGNVGAAGGGVGGSFSYGNGFTYEA